MIKNIKHINSGGFTLIETLIYITLFAFIMSGALVSVYGILGSSSRNQVKAMVEEEGSFILGKIDWALTGIQSESVSADGLTLSVVKYDTSIGNPLVVSYSNNNMQIKRGTSTTNILNNGNVQISCPAVGCFVRTLSTGDGINPESVEVDFTISTKTSEGLSYSQDFSTIKFLRK